MHMHIQFDYGSDEVKEYQDDDYFKQYKGFSTVRTEKGEWAAPSVTAVSSPDIFTLLEVVFNQFQILCSPNPTCTMSRSPLDDFFLATLILQCSMCI